MSIHWTQDQATVYPAIVLMKVTDIVCEDHFTFTFIIQHYVSFVEIYNVMLHVY